MTQEEVAMSKESTRDLQKIEANSVPAAPEQTRPGPVYQPAVDILENDSCIAVHADMPGVKPQDLKIDLRENVLTLSGHVTAPESSSETSVFREYQSGTFFRQFTLSELIDQTKIDAKLTGGVLRLELPKLERAKPRQITVRAG
jgi:HSP20 family molecular chaperone IbpA